MLGSLMLDGGAWDRIASLVSETDFYRSDHQLIFRAIAALVDSNQPCDVVTVSEWLGAQENARVEGGLAYLGELVESTPSAANIAAYAAIVRDRAVLREVLSASAEIAEQVWRTEGRPVEEILDEAEQVVYAIGDRRGAGGALQHVQHVIGGVMARLDELQEKGGAITGVSSGFTDLDQKTAGFQKGDLIVVAGRPSMGKTAFALNLAEAAALGRDQLTVAVFSLEMSSDQLVMRFLSSLGRINHHKVRTGQINHEDSLRITAVMKMLNNSNIFLDDSSTLSPSELRARCRRLKREHDIGLVVVDYLQLMHMPGRDENRVAEISDISRSLKALARELEIPVIALSQLNRSLEARTDRRPRLSDLRESGAIEQDADVILFIYRDEVYNEDSQERGRARIIIGKQRNGPVGEVSLAFLPDIGKFEDFSYQDVPPSYQDM